MKRIYILTYCLLLIVPAFAQWGQAKFTSGQFPVLINKNNSLLLGTDGGVFKSSDQGSTWTLSNTGLSNGQTINRNNVFRLCQTSDRVFKLGDNDRIYASADEGDIWSMISPPLLYFTDIETVGNMLYGVGFDFNNADYGPYIYRSDDNGQSFTIARRLNSSYPINVLKEIDSALFVLEQDTIFYTENGSSFDTILMQGVPSYFYQLGFYGFDKNNLFVFSPDYHIYKYDGNQWMAFTNGLNASLLYYVYFGFTFGNTLYAYGFDNAMYRVQNGGTKWEKDKGTGLPLGYCNALAQVAPDKFIGAGIDGIYKASTEYDASWSAANLDIRASRHRFLKEAGNALFMYTETSLSPYRSTDEGKTWQSSTAGLPVATGFDLQVADNTLYYTSDMIYRSLDYGLSWQETNLPYNSSDAFLGSNGTTIFSYAQGTAYQYFRSTDKGDTYTEITPFIPPGISYVIEIAGNGTDVFLNGITITSSGDIYRSVDNGGSWLPAQQGLTEGTQKHLFIIGSTPYLIDSEIKAIYEWAGSSWQKMGNLPLTYEFEPPIGLNKIGSDFYLATIAAIYKSTDNGQTWSSISANLPEAIELVDMAGLNGNVYLASNGNGIWSNSPALGVVETAEPFGFKAYPNPATDRITLFYALEGSGTVKACLYNMSGVIIKTIEQTASEGVHQLVVDIADVPAGLYFCTMSFEGRLLTRKIVVE